MLNHFRIDSIGFTNYFSGNTHDQRTGRNDFALRNESTGSDDGPRTDDRTVEHDSADTYQAIVLDRGTMNDRSMPNRDTIADGARETRVAVQAAEILNVGLGTDADLDTITSNHGPEQHARLGTNRNVASQCCVLCNEAIFGDEFGLELSVHCKHHTRKVTIAPFRCEMFQTIRSLMARFAEIISRISSVSTLRQRTFGYHMDLDR